MHVAEISTRARIPRLVAVSAVAALLAGACSAGDSGPTPSASQADAISTLIDTELTTDEQRCMLEGLIESEIDPTSVIDGTLSGNDDALLLAVAVGCVEDLAEIPGFVQSFIEGAAQEGAPLTETQARCLIGSIDETDPTALIAKCLDLDDRPPDEPTSDDRNSDDRTSDDEVLLDLLSSACENGNNQACDDLFEVAPEGSAYLELARTCAGQLPDSVGLHCYLELDA